MVVVAAAGGGRVRVGMGKGWDQQVRSSSKSGRRGRQQQHKLCFGFASAVHWSLIAAVPPQSLEPKILNPWSGFRWLCTLAPKAQDPQIFGRRPKDFEHGLQSGQGLLRFADGSTCKGSSVMDGLGSGLRLWGSYMRLGTRSSFDEGPNYSVGVVGAGEGRLHFVQASVWNCDRVLRATYSVYSSGFWAGRRMSLMAHVLIL